LKTNHGNAEKWNAERGKKANKAKGIIALSAFPAPRSELKSGFRLGLPETGDPIAVFPLTAFLEQFRALKTLEHISFAAQRGSRAQTPML
jgi:hypothetical protein